MSRGNLLRHPALAALIWLLGPTAVSAQGGYWVCRATVAPTTYFSDVVGPVPRARYNVLVEDFGKFLQSKYQVSAQASCTFYGVDPAAARDALKQLTSAASANLVLSGWKQGSTDTTAAKPAGASYHCYYSIVLPSDPKHRTMYTDAPFSSDAPKDWLEFWWSEYVLTTYGITNPNNTENACEPLTGTPAAQQSLIAGEETSWKQHNYNIVPVTWTLTKPVPADPNERSKQMQEARLERMQPGAHPVGYCAVPDAATDRRPNIMYFSAFFPGQLREVNLPDNDALKAYREFLEKKYGPVHHGIGKCTVYSSADVARQTMDSQRQVATKSVDTDWTRP